MKVVMIYDQIQAGAGTKDDKGIELNITKDRVGPAVMMEPLLKQNDIQVIATLYCGNGYFKEHEQEVIRKLTAMVSKLKPDVVICGPSFNYLEYSEMCAKVATQIEAINIHAICAMSEENEAIIEEYKNKVKIIRCPKKGGSGLSDTLKSIVQVACDLYEGRTIVDQTKLY